MNETTSISEEIMNINNTGERSVHECDTIAFQLACCFLLSFIQKRKKNIPV